MAWENYDDVLAQIQDRGLLVEVLDVDTAKFIKTHTRDRPKGDKKGWYRLSTVYLSDPDGDGQLEYIAGAFGIFEADDAGKEVVELKRDRSSLTQSDRDAIRERQREARKAAERHEQQVAARAARRAQLLWSRYLPSGQSAYLDKKGIQAHGARFHPDGGGTILVPIQDEKGWTHGVQIIRDPAHARGRSRKRRLEKQYWPKGLKVQGHFFLIGLPRDVILVAEGFATAASVHEATGLPVVVAFHASNLKPVAERVQKAWKSARILVCADDDYQQKCKMCGALTPVADTACAHCGQPHQQRNPGIHNAKLAAEAVQGAWVAPVFPGDRAGKKITDFDDLKRFPSAGELAIRDQIIAALEVQGWSVAAAISSEGNDAKGGGGRRRACSVLDVDTLIDRFIPLDDGTGKYVFDTWTNKIVHRDQMVALLPAGSRWDDVKRHAVWKERGAYYLDEVGFDPAGTDDSVKLNTWQGWPMEPKAGECGMMLDLIDYLCAAQENGDEIRDWLLKWMAYPLQNPGAKMATAVVMHGPQGTGKSAVFQTLAKIYGDYATVLNQRGLEDKFNADWVDSKLFLLAEEVVARQEMWHVKNELKELITGEWVRVNTKHTAAYRQKNQINIAFLSNEAMPVPIEPDDRRHAVIWTPPEMSADFYQALFDELDNGGVQAFYHYLLNLDLTGFTRHTRPPMTEAKRQLMDVAKPSEDRFLEDWIAGDTDYPMRPCLSTDLYQAYLAWCRVYGVRFPREHPQLMAKVNKRPGWKVGPQHVYDSTRYEGKARKRMVIPAATDLPPEHQKPADKTQAQWLTDQYVEFTRHLGGSNYD
ncbi:DUF5906 domain-containing protein [Thioalkalivibrio sp. ALE6]|uniref:DUF5906 domain-containing protein n=1 Tax=Thioalkalivibrio sp. ALE6 TaxID=1266908 RepID=UPI0005718AFD|nr:DUF5906 domain-containing protein [Thioalkalivibrio sp. ALE6]